MSSEDNGEFHSVFTFGSHLISMLEYFRTKSIHDAGEMVQKFTIHNRYWLTRMQSEISTPAF